MDFDPWWLILVPVLFGLGWIAARVDVRQMLSETRKLPDSYFRGLNFLLNEQPDRAIDAFIEVVKLDPETVELHFALGSLFRRRGELERAIRVHQNLIQRSDLPEAQRQQALHELAHDYLKAGMLDRAEDGFQRLKDTRYAADALRALIRIYEAEHDWGKAISAVQTLRNLVDEPVPQAVHYYCEQATAALNEQPPKLDAAHQALDAAVNMAGDANATASSSSSGAPQGAVRIALLKARLAGLEGDGRTERTSLEWVINTHPEFAGMAAPELLANAQSEGRLSAALESLQRVYAAHPSQDLFDAIFEGLNRAYGSDAAWKFARSALQRKPSLLGLDRLLQAQLKRPAEASAASPAGSASTGQHKRGVNGPQPDAHGVASGLPQETPYETRDSAGQSAPSHDQDHWRWISDDDAALMRSLINRPAQRLGRYACLSCGFRAKRFYWQCPGCNTWETYLPKRLEELEGS